MSARSVLRGNGVQQAFLMRPVLWSCTADRRSFEQRSAGIEGDVFMWPARYDHSQLQESEVADNVLICLSISRRLQTSIML